MKRAWVRVWVCGMCLSMLGACAQTRVEASASVSADRDLDDSETVWEKIDAGVYGVLGVGAAALGILLPLKVWK